MNFKHVLTIITLLSLSMATAQAQVPAKEAAENEIYKKMVGVWDLTMKAAGAESKGTVTYKLDLDGMWLSSSLETELFGMKYMGKGMDSYNRATKKYTSLWLDNMSSNATMMEGTLDPATKKLTLTGNGLNMEGKMVKMKSVTEMPNDDTMLFSMYEGDGKEPSFTIIYKKKK